MECGQAVRMGRLVWGRRDEGGGFAGARERFVGVRVACVGTPAGFVAGATSLAGGGACLDAACRSFVGASASCCGPSTSDVAVPASFVGGTANDVDGPTYDHDSFESNVGAST